MRALALAVVLANTALAAHAGPAEIAKQSVTQSVAAPAAPRFTRVEKAPMRVEMTINVEARGITVGEGRDVFEFDGKEYRVSSDARTAGVARLFKRMDEKRESHGRVTVTGIQPLSFHQERTGKAPKTATFDWTRRTLRLEEGDDSETVPLPAFTLDQTSLTYAFFFVEPPRKGGFHVHVTDGRRLPEYDVVFVGQERIRSPLGELDTLRYRKVQAGDDKRGFEFWLSIAHHNLPVRVRIVEKDGTAFDSNVTKLNFTAR